MNTEYVADKAVKCPTCKKAYKFYEVHFPVINDNGYWVIKCSNCDKPFALKILNPIESSFMPNYLVESREEDAPVGIPFATEFIDGEFEQNNFNLCYSYESMPLYKCSSCNRNMEIISRNEIDKRLSDIKSRYNGVKNIILAGRYPVYSFFVVRLPITCTCLQKSIATYYCKFWLNDWCPNNLNDLLLSNVNNSKFETEINGLYSKTVIMDYLEKLLIRWNLYCKQIIIAVPFVGHQYLKTEQKLSTWNWLLEKLDPNRTAFITRPKEYGGYKNALEESKGVSHKLLSEFHLENKVVASNLKKNDFHAKFYAGIFGDKVEILAGSANLVKGPSIENAAFCTQEYDWFVSHYLDILKIVDGSVKM